MSDDVGELLRRRGLRVTAQRVAMMRAVSDHPHSTADQLGVTVRRAIGSVSRQAIYDTLSALVDSQLVRRIQPAGGAARYEDRVNDNHHHLVCRHCHTVIDIDCAVDAAPCLTPDDDHGFELDEAEVVFWGQCPNCQTANDESPPERTTVPVTKEQQ